MKRAYKTVTALLIATAMIWGSVGGTAAADGAVQPDKEEVIYALLAADGAVKSVYAVNAFNVSESCVIEDYGSYNGVTNLTSTETMTLSSGRVTVAADQGRFYYQGALTGAQLPWTVKIAYALDGAAIGADKLAGRSGALAMTIAVSLNPLADAEYADNYLLQTTVTLDTALATDIAAEGATIANAGANKALSFQLMPGEEAVYTVTANVTDFEMDAVTLNAVPMSFSFSYDTSDMTGQLTDLADAIKELNDAATELADGADDLAGGAAKLKSGSRTFRSGLNSIAAGSAQLNEGSAAINDALAAIAAGLAGMTGEDSDLAALAQLPAGLDSAAGGLRTLAASMGQLADGYAAGYAAMNAAVGALPAAQDFSALAASEDQQVLALLQAYGNLAAAAGTVSGTWSGYAQVFGSVETALDTYAGQLTAIAASLEAAADQLESGDVTGQLTQLSATMTQLSAQYAQFHAGLAQYTGGVDSAAAGYVSLNSGIASLASGAGEYADGMGEFADGMNELHTETADIDEEVANRLDELLAEFDRSDYVPTSFMSPMNGSVTAVQFVIKADGVTKTAEAAAEPAETEPVSFLDRLLALFGI